MTFESLSPVLHVTDVQRSIAYYTTKLGFELDFTWEEPPSYGGVRPDGVLRGPVTPLCAPGRPISD